MPRFALLMLLTAIWPAASHARDNERRGDRARSVSPAEVQRALPPQLVPAPAPAADPRQLRRDGRLSPEERRQLRRDINDAGRELYRRQRQQRQD